MKTKCEAHPSVYIYVQIINHMIIKKIAKFNVTQERSLLLFFILRVKRILCFIVQGSANFSSTFYHVSTFYAYFGLLWGLWYHLVKYILFYLALQDTWLNKTFVYAKEGLTSNIGQVKNLKVLKNICENNEMEIFKSIWKLKKY